jgi:ribosome-associated protein
MNLKQELQNLNNRLDKSQRKLAAAVQRGDAEVESQIKNDIETIDKKITSLKGQQTQQVSGKGKGIAALAFNRPITKAEQADMGKLKKSVRGLVVVHPMTALGREMGVKVVTGFASAEF